MEGSSSAGEIRMQKKQLGVAWRAFLSLVLVLTASAALRADESEGKSSEKSKKDDDYALMKVFVDTFDQVERNYVKDVDRRELLQAAIEGMMSRLDPYSTYITPEEMTRFSESVDQEFGGIGITVHKDEPSDRLVVMSPLPGTPAYRAGIRAGDVIMEIDGKSAKGITIERAVHQLKGKPGESVKIGIRHAGEEKVDQVTLVRDIIHVPTVLGDRYKPDGSWDFMLDKEKKIGYVRLTHFSRHSAIELEKAVNELLEEGMKGLVLDLRFDPGGLFSQATEIADMFIDSGVIVSTKGRNTPTRTWEAKKEGTFPNFPMAVIINHYSASASEIVAACLQDHHRAVIVGDRSWGKGSVQNVIELEGGASALKLTTASYHRPSGKNIHRFPGAKESDEWGVKPDPGYNVKFTPSEILEYSETYRPERDILSKNGPGKSDFKDRQLVKALDAVREKMAAADTAAQKPNKPAEKAKANAPASKKAADRGPARKQRTQFGVG
jgi:carboxyl-terminal processing protease